MRIIKVLPAKKWYNPKTGQTASLFGSIPWHNEKDKNNWKIQQCGWTWLNSNGTVGIGRKPVETEIEAIEIMNKINNL